MGLVDRFTKRWNFADGNSLTPTKAKGQGSAEVGVAGENVIGSYEEEESRVDKLSVADYVKMRQNDGTVSSLYNILTLPILANTYEIHADENDSGEEVADFVRDNLLLPPQRGGMEIPLNLKLADWLRAVLEGFRLDEKVFEVRDGKILYKKLATRDSQTITLLRADDGGYGGARQRTTFKGRFIDTEIPAWKTFLFTFGKDKNYLYGESAFKPIHYHYDIKHKLLYLANLQAQTRAVNPLWVRPGQNADKSETTKKRILTELTNLGRVRSVGYVPSDYELNVMTMGQAHDLMPLIEHQNSEMARSLLAQFLMLGTQSGSVGSWALSENHSDLFLIALKGVMQNLEDHINYYVIPDLVDLNFGNEAYPEFRFDDMTSDAKQLVREAFVQLLKNGAVSDALVKGVEDMVADNLEIDTDAINEELEKQKEKEEEANPPVAPPVAPPVPPIEPQPNPVNQGDRPGRPLAFRTGSGRSRPPRDESTFHDLKRALTG